MHNLSTMTPFSLGLPAVHSCFSREAADEGALLGVERELSAGFAAGRRREFATGRRCAREALRGLGLAAAPIGVGAHREPCWPAGVTGSISHASGLAGAMVALRSDYRSVGLDIERCGAVGAELVHLVLTPRERDWVGGDTALATRVFSLKEAFYKMQFPLTGRFLDFTDVETGPDLSSVRVLCTHPETGSHRMGQTVWEGYLVSWVLSC
jgi:4'-phosphopantetheinyl transferase EntD